jgi:uncharacterized protein YndB with AHSA1/START domain
MTSTASATTDREYVMSRVFDAPRDLVFKAYTDPEIVPQWWGQRASTTIVDKSDVRTGGSWRYVQREADGTEYAFRGEYLEVTPPERIVNTFEFEPMPGHIVTDTAVFEEIDGKTKLTVTSLFDTVEDLKGMLETGMESGANESWDLLAEYLAKVQ